MKFYYIIKVSGEMSSWPEYIADTFEEARAHVKDYASWYSNKGTCAIEKINNKFERIKRWNYRDDKLVVSNSEYDTSEKVDHD